jgi:hypothetical protein
MVYVLILPIFEENEITCTNVMPTLTPGANPTTVSYNAGAVKIYNVTSRLVRFKKNSCTKHSSLLQR